MKGLRFRFFSFLSVILLSAIRVFGFAAEDFPITTQRIIETLQKSYYGKIEIDDEISKKLLNHFIDSLDPSHSIFLAQDIQSFESDYKNSLDDQLKMLDTNASSKIFKLFLARYAEVETELDEFFKTDINLNSGRKIVSNRKKSQWPQSPQERKLISTDIYASILMMYVGGGESLEEAKKTLKNQIRRRLKIFRGLKDEDIYQLYMNTLMTLYDPHSNYIAPQSTQNFKMGLGMENLKGIGATIQLNDSEEAIILDLIAGGPAEKSGLLLPGDRLLAVAQEDGVFVPVPEVNVRLDDIISKIRGPIGTRVSLKVERKVRGLKEQKIISITRDEIKMLLPQARAMITELPNSQGKNLKVGLIRLPSFYASETNPQERVWIHTKKLLEEFKKEKVNSIILDLRDNGGGNLEDAVRMVGLFVDGVAVQYAVGGKVKLYRAPDVVYSGPLMVLVNKGSASASEIVAAALQDYNRAIVVGAEVTHGKGTVQTVLPISSNRGLFAQFQEERSLGIVKLTTGKFYRVTGKTTQRFGVTPDIILPSRTLDYEGEDELEAALNSDSISPCNVRSLNFVAPYIEQLKLRSRIRVSRTPEFSYISDELAKLRDKKERDEVVIDLNAYKAEREKNQLRLKERELERSKRGVQNFLVKHISSEGEQRISSSIYDDPFFPGRRAPAKADPASPIVVSELEYENRAVLDEALSILVDYQTLLQGNVLSAAVR